MKSDATPAMSVVHGLPLTDEAGIGSTTMAGYLREVTTRFAGREAVVMPGNAGAARWTYDMLWDRSVEVARALIAHGVVKDTRVGILMTNRAEFLSTLFGTALAGGVAVVFSTFSTPLELGQLLQLGTVSVLVFEGEVLKKDFGAMLAELEPLINTGAPGRLNSTRFPFLQHLIKLDSLAATAEKQPPRLAGVADWQSFLSQGQRIAPAVVEARAASVQPSDAGGIFFSSGTTSLPKGILHTQRAFVLQWWRYPTLAGVEGPVRCWTGNGFFWSANIGMTVGLAFSTGGTIILQPHFEPEATLRLIEEERIDYISGRPHQWARLLEASNWKSADLSGLRYITRGELMWTHPTVKTRWVIFMGYGNTETMSICTSNAYNNIAEEVDGCFGTPAPGNALKIVDPDSGVVVTRGTRGEVRIKGATLMMGYIGKSNDEVLDDEGYFPTGDGGYVDEEGRLWWEGRLTEIIKTGGANVSPIEIDEALALYPGVRRAQTVGVPHDTLGEMVVSCVAANDGITLDADAITAFLKERLASFKIPKRILFVSDDEISVTGSGKVKVTQLRDVVAARLAQSK